MIEAIKQTIAAVTLTVAFALSTFPARGEDSPALYVVSYIEVVPGKTDEARRLLRDYAAEARRAAGAVAIDVLKRDFYRHQFALLEQWQSQKSRDDHQSTPAAQRFRAALAGLESAGVDERILGPLLVAPPVPAAASAITVITHIDVIPPALDQAKARIKRLVDETRHRTGNLRFDVLVQTDRPNHMTLIEGWKSRADKDAESAAAETISFRKDLLQMSGSPYDERIYRPLD
jgi:quinol monooxygenase YgiN